MAGKKKTKETLNSEDFHKNVLGEVIVRIFRDSRKEFTKSNRIPMDAKDFNEFGRTPDNAKTESLWMQY